ncbi:MAG: translocation/assembly module TamB domain-containing protein [Alphaproteobacteria bacterium]|nr:translocation/assembly module TamB domain-containing protein [Alphaproteobacteria bacterium]MCB9985915.1 translocation/assembly module TamB domain-containing protein [Micavibrio sp.]
MGSLVQNSKHFIVRALLLIVTLCLFFAVVIQIGFVVVINAFNTGKAHDFLQTQLTSALEDSGYNVTFNKLIYDPVRGFSIYNINILDKDGTIATVDKFTLDISFSKMPLRQLDLIVNAGEVNFVRLPMSQRDEKEVAENKSLPAFSIPNIYFKTVRILRLNVGILNIGAAVMGKNLSFTPIIKATVNLGESLTVDVSLLPKPSTKIGDVELPEKIEIVGMFAPSTASFVLNNLLISSPDCNFNGKGNGYLTEDGEINFNFSAVCPDLKKLTQESLKSADLSFTINGNYHHPAIRLDGVIVPSSLKEKGVADIMISATADDIADNLKGNIDITTSYLKDQVSLSAALSYADDVLTLESIKGTAPQVTLDGEGEVSTKNNVVDGKLSVTATDLSYYKSLLSKDIGGALKIDAILKLVNEAQALDVMASATQIKFETTQVRKADAEFHFDNVKNPWPQSANVQISNLSLSETVSLDKAEVIMKDTGNDAYNLSVIGNGNIPYAVSFKGVTNISNITNDFPTLSNIDFKATFGKSSVSLAGALDHNMIDLQASAENFLGSDFPVVLPDTLRNLRLNGDVVMSGEPAAPLTKANFIGSGIDTEKYKNLSMTVNANHQDGKIFLALSGKGSEIKELQANIVFPITFSLFPFAFDMNMNSPLSGDLLADFDLGAISPLFLQPSQTLSAGLKANAILGGTLSVPDVNGTLKIKNGQFADEQNGIHLSVLNVNSSFTKDALIVESLTATDGEKGKMSGHGHLDFATGGNTDLSITMKNFHLPSSRLADGMMDATFSLSNSNVGYALNGTVDINHINIMIPETFQSKIPELNIVTRQSKSSSAAVGQAIALAIKVNAPDRIFVRGWGLDAEFGGNLNVSGNAITPLFDGNFVSKRGRYEEFGKRFTLARANLRFQGEVPPSPYLDIEATTPADDVTASVLLTGPLTQPSIAFSSTPVLPQDEVLSRILFGRNASKITPFQAIKLAQTLRRFSGEGGDGGINPLDMLRSTTGLDDISIDTDTNGETNVGVGKYLTDKVYLEFEKGKAANSGGANIQIEVTPSINVQSEIGHDAQAGGGIFWKRDY